MRYKWWSIGDAPGERKFWFCPWCGARNKMEPGTNPLPAKEG